MAIKVEISSVGQFYRKLCAKNFFFVMVQGIQREKKRDKMRNAPSSLPEKEKKNAQALRGGKKKEEYEKEGKSKTRRQNFRALTSTCCCCCCYCCPRLRRLIAFAIPFLRSISPLFLSSQTFFCPPSPRCVSFSVLLFLSLLPACPPPHSLPAGVTKAALASLVVGIPINGL